ncbi:MAG: sigma 54-interacting transcriptional regulator [Deltaproteobacteria bacterium]|nr:sigma 54-interacting transcriptional regulator [Deltaproteobacteria bacterium]
MLPWSGMIGEHPSIKEIQEIIQRVAVTDTAVLFTGESGTGKELAARAIHNLGPRGGRPFVPVNCATISETFLENELFGHARGAFSGAVASRSGMFQLADGGTLFLDEVGEIPPSLQAKLLRVLQNGEVRPIGANQAVAVNVRVIASTNKDLAHHVEKGSFREDLFFRLQVIPIHFPPLRARRSDIPLLINHFLERANRKHGSSVTISREASIYLWEYDWPGNIRELENLVERLVILSDDGVTDLKDLPANIRSFVSDKKSPQPTLGNGQIDLREATEQLERRLLEEALRLTNGNKSAAARMLGLKRTTLGAKLRRKSGFGGGADARESEPVEAFSEFLAASDTAKNA